MKSVVYIYNIRKRKYELYNWEFGTKRWKRNITYEKESMYHIIDNLGQKSEKKNELYNWNENNIFTQ